METSLERKEILVFTFLVLYLKPFKIKCEHFIEMQHILSLNFTVRDSRSKPISNLSTGVNSAVSFSVPCNRFVLDKI